MPAGAIPFPFGDCKICKDKATGVHYGVATCEGCKGFFKRSITKAEKYKCFFGGQCVLSPQNRNRCKACRFQRCMNSGMSVNSVKMGRIPKVEKERALEMAKDRGDTRFLPNTAEGASRLGQDKSELHNGGLPMNNDGSGDDMGPMYTGGLPPPGGLTGGPAGGLSLPYEHDDLSSRLSQNMLHREHHLYNRPNSFLGEMFNSSQNGHKIIDSSPEPESSDLKSLAGLPPPPASLPHFPHFDRQNSFPFDNREMTSSHRKLFPSADDFNYHYSNNMSSRYDITKTSSHNNNSSSAGYTEHLFSHANPLGGVSNTNSYIPNSSASSQLPSSTGPSVQQPASSSLTISNPTSQPASVNPQPASLPASVNSHHPLIFPKKSKSHCKSDSGISDSSESSPDSVQQTQESNGVVEVTNVQRPSSTGHYSPGIIKTLICQIFETGNGEELKAALLNKALEMRPKIEGQLPGSEVHVKQEVEEDVVMDADSSCPGNDSPTQRRSSTGLPLKAFTPPGGCEFATPSLDEAMDIDDIDAIKIEPPSPSYIDPMLAATMERSRDHEAKLRSVHTAEYKHFNNIKSYIQMMRDELAGRRQPHPINTIKKASFQQVSFMWENLFQCIPKVNKQILGMCQDLDGFNSLDKYDQTLLIKEAYFEIWLIEFSRLFYNKESYLRINYDIAYSVWWMKHFLTESLIDRMFDFCDRLNACKLSLIEIVSLIAVQLTSPERDGLRDRASVEVLHQKYKDVLFEMLHKNHPKKNGHIVFEMFTLIAKLPALQQEQTNLIGRFTVDKPHVGCIAYHEDCEDLTGIPEELVHEYGSRKPGSSKDMKTMMIEMHARAMAAGGASLPRPPEGPPPTPQTTVEPGAGEQHQQEIPIKDSRIDGGSNDMAGTPPEGAPAKGIDCAS